MKTEPTSVMAASLSRYLDEGIVLQFSPPRETQDLHFLDRMMAARNVVLPPRGIVLE